MNMTTQNTTPAPTATATATTTGAAANDAGTDTKKWSLGKYFWACVVHAVRNRTPTPRLEFCFDSTRVFVLRVDDDNPRQFLLIDYGDQDALHDDETGEPIDLDALNEVDWPQSRRGYYSGVGGGGAGGVNEPLFPLIIDDDESTSTTARKKASLFAAEIIGSPSGIESAYGIVKQCFEQDYETLLRSRGLAGGRPSLDASVTMWNAESNTDEIDRRYVDIIPHGMQSIHVRGTPHPTTVKFSACGRNALICVRTMHAALQLRAART